MKYLKKNHLMIIIILLLALQFFYLYQIHGTNEYTESDISQETTPSSINIVNDEVIYSQSSEISEPVFVDDGVEEPEPAPPAPEPEDSSTGI